MLFDAEKQKDTLRKEAENAYGLIHNIEILKLLNEGDILFIDNSSIRKPTERDIGEIGYVSEIRSEFDDRGGSRAIPIYFKPQTCYLIMSDGKATQFVSTFTHCTVYGGSQLFTKEEEVDRQFKKYNTSFEDFPKLKL